MNSGQGVNYEVSGCVLITAESDAVPVYQSLAGIVFCFRIITSRADTPRRFVLGKSSSHMTIPLRQGSSRRVFVSGVFVSLCAEPRRGQLVLVVRRVRELPINMVEDQSYNFVPGGLPRAPQADAHGGLRETKRLLATCKLPAVKEWGWCGEPILARKVSVRSLSMHFFQERF